MQYVSRINIRVRKKEQWKNLMGIDLSKYGLFGFAEDEMENLDKEFIIDGDWSATEQELNCVVSRIAMLLDYDCIIVADTTNINVDPYTFCAYYIAGSYTKTKLFSSNSKKAEMSFEANIFKIKEWLKYGGFRLQEKELEALKKFKINITPTTKAKKEN